MTRATKIGKLPSRRNSTLESDLEWQLKALDIGYAREFKFDPVRRWRFDFRLADCVCVECEGLTFYGNHLGRHQSAKGYATDLEKYNEALVQGWKVLRITKEHIKSGQAIDWIKALLKK